ncbi:FAD-dependent oxidoreductase [Williamsia deligens]|uniref:FAD-dependent oxidoreductase n=1 Tax=Williamsia deligens TaxID=321325 RepID=A0ABW3GAU4_9NOCA|nr:FAD-dependent oxidoreductase [Williamsia deligens]MCP2193346.1 Glycine/D-amino acid oxidase (deaminating) [Williamsia deligens]
MSSLWLENRPVAPHPGTEVADLTGSRYDHVVVGAGITGLVTGVLLARAGATVAVIEARTAGAVTTGHTTGKVSLLQGTRLSTIASRHDSAVVAAYVDANREGMEWLLRFCADAGIPVDRETAITYASDDKSADTVVAEHRAALEAGLDVQMVADTDLPFDVAAAVALPDQAQLDPMPVLDALAEDLRSHGGVLIEGVRVRGTGLPGLGIPGLPSTGDLTLRTDHGHVRAGSVTVATGMPILDRGAHFARLTAQRSYSAVFSLPDDQIPRSMSLAAGSPSVSLRYAWRPSPDGDERVLMVGGFGHETGRTGSERAHVEELIRWTRATFPGAELRSRWSAQDYSSVDELPVVGPVLPGESRVLVATGFSKWGMTNGVAAAIACSGRLLGGRHPWADVYRSWRPSQVTSVVSAAQMNAQVGMHMARGWVGALTRSVGPAPTADGDGRVGRDGVRPVGRCRVDGETTDVTPVCPHLGGILHWNAAEESWDCPLHGSRFDARGAVLEGPATRDLP